MRDAARSAAIADAYSFTSRTTRSGFQSAMNSSVGGSIASTLSPAKIVPTVMTSPCAGGCCGIASHIARSTSSGGEAPTRKG